MFKPLILSEWGAIEFSLHKKLHKTVCRFSVGWCLLAVQFRCISLGTYSMYKILPDLGDFLVHLLVMKYDISRTPLLVRWLLKMGIFSSLLQGLTQDEDTVSPRDYEAGFHHIHPSWQAVGKPPRQNLSGRSLHLCTVIGSLIMALMMSNILFWL